MVALSFVTELSLITSLLVAMHRCTARSLPEHQPEEPALDDYEQVVKSVETQLSITHLLFAEEKKNIEFVYSKIMNEFDQEYSYEFLPKKLLAWYDEEVHGIPHLPPRMEQVLPVMHTSLQIFDVAFSEVQNFVVRDEVKAIRNAVIKKLTIYLRQLLLEVESAMSTLRIEIPPTASADLIRSESSWNPDPDYTIALIQEWGVVSSYRRFVEEWLQIMSKIYSKKKSRRSN